MLGTHPGHELFTVGQRRGLGGSVPASGEPLYVLGKDAATNRLTVGPHETCWPAASASEPRGSTSTGTG